MKKPAVPVPESGKMKLDWPHFEFPHRNESGLRLKGAYKRLPFLSWSLISKAHLFGHSENFGEVLLCDKGFPHVQVEMDAHKLKDLCGDEF